MHLREDEGMGIEDEAMGVKMRGWISSSPHLARPVHDRRVAIEAAPVVYERSV
jgi:hypothetical protein